MRASARRTAAAVDLTCLPGGAVPEARTAMGAWGSLGDALYPAWSAMADSELSVYERLGEDLGEKLLVLWAISRFRDSGEAGPTLAELIDEAGRPRFGDPLVEDMLLAAFALGASWARREPPGALPTERPRLRLAGSPPDPA